MEYEHKGIKITFQQANGEFTAAIQGEYITAPSLAAIQKRIDKAGKFEPFTALAFSPYHQPEAFQRLTIVGINKARKNARSWRTEEHSYRTSTGIAIYPRNLFTDTPENEAALIEQREEEKRYHAEYAEARDKHDKNSAAITAKLKSLPNITDI